MCDNPESKIAMLAIAQGFAVTAPKRLQDHRLNAVTPKADQSPKLAPPLALLAFCRIRKITVWQSKQR